MLKNMSILSLNTAVEKRKIAIQQGHKRKGFFSIEFAIIIVVALILLAAYLYKSSSLVGSANHTAAMRDMDTIRSAILIYQTQTGHLPEKLDDLLNPISETDAVDHREHAPLLDPGTRGGSVKDPWGKEYEYHVNDDKISGHIICSEGGSGNTTVQF